MVRSSFARYNAGQAMTSTEPSRPVRWGILGTARIATKVGRAIDRARGAVLAAVASRDKSRADAWVAAHTRSGSPADDARAFLEPGAIATCGSYLEILDDPNIDAVYIPLPPSLHCQWTCLAAERGKHVLCEKPLGMDLAEAQQMADACAAGNRQLMDGVMWLHHERTLAMREIIRSDRLGSLRRVTSGFSLNGADLGPQNIRFQSELGGGALGDLGWYCVGAALWAFGELPQQVFATARYERNVDMNLSAMLWFREDRMVSFDCGFDVVWRKWFEIAGTRGSIVCDDFVNPWDAGKARFWVHDSQGQGTQHLFPDCVQEMRMIERFCEIVQSGRLDAAWPSAALATQRVCDALAQSARTGTIVEMDPGPGIHESAGRAPI
jgi:predicted dehydrogenase